MATWYPKPELGQIKGYFFIYKMLQLKCFLPVCGVVLAYLYIRNKEPYDVGDIRAKQIIDAWQKQITAPKESFNRVAVG